MGNIRDNIHNKLFFRNSKFSLRKICMNTQLKKTKYFASVVPRRFQRGQSWTVSCDGSREND